MLCSLSLPLSLSLSLVDLASPFPLLFFPLLGGAGQNHVAAFDSPISLGPSVDFDRGVDRPHEPEGGGEANGACDEEEWNGLNDITVTMEENVFSK